MFESLGIREGDGRRGRAGDDAVKRRIIERRGDDVGAAHLIEMGHEVTYGRDEGVRVHDLHGINAASVSIDEIGSRERKLAVTGLPTAGAIGVPSKNAALV
jgi:hypothetical protein